MGQVDSSIPLGIRIPQIKSPVEHYSNALALQNAQQANEFNALKMSQAQFEDQGNREADAAMRAYYSSPRDAAALNALGRQSPRAFAIEQKRRLEEEKDRAEIGSKKSTSRKNDVESTIKVHERNANMLRGVQDQTSWDMVRDQIIREIGPDQGASVPVQFDPKYRDMLLQATLSEKDRLEAEHKNRTQLTTEANNNVTVGPNGVLTPNRVAIDAKKEIAQSGVGQVPIQIVPTKDGMAGVTTRVVRGQPEISVIPINEPGGGRAQPAPSNAGGSEDERKAAGWFQQSVFAFKNMTDALSKDPAAAQPTASERALQFLPGAVGDDAANARRSPQRQRYMQAASSFSEAVLRAATGAGVNKEEALQKVNELTPRYGDAPEVIQQKQEALSMYLESLRTRAGRALPPGTPLPPGAGTPPADAPAAAGPAKPTSQSDYEALPSGATYVAPDGTTRRKR